MTQPKIVPVAIDNLELDLENPRNPEQDTQSAALLAMLNLQYKKLLELASDIAANGLNPSDLPMIISAGEDNKFIVVEGNRRLAALKLLNNPNIVSLLGASSDIQSKFATIKSGASSPIPETIYCSLFDSREDARKWILLKHTGENEGKGVVRWTAIDAQRFKGTIPVIGAIDLAKNGGFLDKVTLAKLPKIPFTNLKRILDAPSARKLIGLSINGNDVVLQSEEALKILSMIVADIAHRRTKVTDIDNVDLINTYVSRVISNIHSQKSVTDENQFISITTSSEEHQTFDAGSSTVRDDESSNLLSSVNGAPAASSSNAATTSKPQNNGKGEKSPTVKNRNPDRSTIIPKSFKLSVNHERINKIYAELRKLEADDFPNCAGVTLRVFLELSVDEYASRNNISLVDPPKQTTKGIPCSNCGTVTQSTSVTPPREFNLRNKLEAVADYLEGQNLLDKAKLKGIRRVIADKEHFLSVDMLNAYVHNKDYHPIPSDLKETWNNIQPFVEAIWK